MKLVVGFGADETIVTLAPYRAFDSPQPIVADTHRRAGAEIDLDSLWLALVRHEIEEPTAVHRVVTAGGEHGIESGSPVDAIVAPARENDIELSSAQADEVIAAASSHEVVATPRDDDVTASRSPQHVRASSSRDGCGPAEALRLCCIGGRATEEPHQQGRNERCRETTNRVPGYECHSPPPSAAEAIESPPTSGVKGLRLVLVRNRISGYERPLPWAYGVVTFRRWILDWKLEVVTIPVSDFDRARDFYAEKVGFKVDIDHEVGEGVRFLQLTPPGSGCSIHLARSSSQSAPGATERMDPGSLEGLFLVVSDVRAARDELVGKGVEVGEVLVYDSGDYRPANEGESLDLVGVFFFEDLDGNRWIVQQIPPKG
jgi:catechol 2,3-dioxygenase-like lactoylglutathione lyase family enzyme